MGFLAWGAGLVNGVSQFGGGVWGGFTGSVERQRQQQDQQETQGIQDGQAKFAQSEARFKTQYAAAGFDPPMIQAQDNWQQLSHQEIWAKNQKLNNPPLAFVAKAWHDLNEKLLQTADDYSKGLQQKIQAAWQGKAADAALNVGKPLSDWMTQSAGLFKSTGDQVSTVSDAADHVKNLVGQPKGFDLGQAFGSSLGRGPVGDVVGAFTEDNDVVQQMQQQHSEEQAARDAMARVYAPTYQQVDAQLPAFQDVHGNTVTPPPATPPPSGPLPPPVSSGGGSVHSGATGGTAGGNLPGGGGSASAGGGSVSGGGSPSTGMGSGTQATTSAAAAAPTMGLSLGTPGAGGGAVGAGSGGTGTGGLAGGLGSAVGGLGGAIGGRAGMGAGGRTGLSSGTSGRAGSAGSSGAAGRGGASGGATGGTGRSEHGGEEEEHERSTWLEEPDDIWLNDMPSVAPPVFGASTERD